MSNAKWIWSYGDFELYHNMLLSNRRCEKDFWNSALNAVKPNQFGMSVVAPQLAKVPSYQNDAVWPFVQAYRGLALKKAGLEEFTFLSKK